MLLITCQSDMCCLAGDLRRNATYDAYELSGLGKSLPFHLQSMLPQLPQRNPHRIDGEHLSHLIFAVDIVLVAKSPEAMESMLTDIHIASKSVGPSMHLSKTKEMLNENATTSMVAVHGNTIDKVDLVRR